MSIRLPALPPSCKSLSWRNQGLFLLIFCVCLHFPLFSAQADEQLIVTLTLNQQKKGDFFVILKDSGDFLVSASDLASVGFQQLPPDRIDIDGVPHLSLVALLGVESRFDEISLTLELTADPKLLATTTIDLSSKRRSDVIYPRDNSIFLNYGFDYSADSDDDFHFEGLTLTNELGVRHRDLLLLTDSLYRESPEDSRFTRLNSSLIWDDRQTMLRIVSGDLFAASGELGSRVQLGGLSVSKLYRIDPYFIRYPLFDVSGLASLPSDVELYVDGVKVRSQRFDPGEFELRNFQGSGGAQTIEVVVRDALGREERIIAPFYFTDQVLRHGLHEYSYNIGLLRRDFGEQSNNYSDLAFSAFHRYGVSDELNFGLRGEAGNGLSNFGLEAVIKTGSIGLVRLEGAGSQDGDSSGAAGFFSYEYSDRQYRGRLALQGFSEEYQTLSDSETETSKRKINFLAGIGYVTKRLGSFGLDFSLRENYSEPEHEVLSLSWSRILWNRTYVNTTFRQIREVKTAYEAGVNLTWYFDQNHTLYGAVRREQDKDIQTIEARRNTPSGEGTGWSVLGERTEQDQTQSSLLNTMVQHNARAAILRGDFSLNRSETLTKENLRLSVAGALVHVGDTYAVTRPVTDSFALVSIGQADGVGVYVNGQTSGHTNRHGKVVIPELSSYYENQISIEDKDIPLDYLMPRVRLNLSPPLRSGSCVNFPLQKYQAFTGTLVVGSAEGLVPLANTEIDLATPVGPLTFWTGGEGEFYLDSQQVEFDLAAHQGCEALGKKEETFLPAGDYPLTIKREGEKIQTAMPFPFVADQYADLGEIVLPISIDAADPSVLVEPAAAATVAVHTPEVVLPKEAPVEQEESWPEMTTIHFPFDRITPVAADIIFLETVTNILLTRPGFSVQIEGHTCQVGKRSYNARLAYRRAEAIRNYLMTKGVAAQQISQITSYGELRPECTETSADCLRQNRRVVLLLVKTPAN